MVPPSLSRMPMLIVQLCRQKDTEQTLPPLAEDDARDLLVVGWRSARTRCAAEVRAASVIKTCTHRRDGASVRRATSPQEPGLTGGTTLGRKPNCNACPLGAANAACYAVRLSPRLPEATARCICTSRNCTKSPPLAFASYISLSATSSSPSTERGASSKHASPMLQVTPTSQREAAACANISRKRSARAEQRPVWSRA